MTAHRRYILNDAGEPEPCDDLFTWAAWIETADLRVAQDLDEGGENNHIRVSTVFLGINYNFTGEGPPVLWETMVLGGLLDGRQRRYASLEAALLGHQAICQEVSASVHHQGEVQVDD